MTDSVCDTAETEAPPAAIAALRVLFVTESRYPQPLTVGVPWPRGALRTADVTLTDDAGDTLPRQTEVLARWPDGSIKWLLVETFVAGRGAREQAWQVCPDELECSDGSSAMAKLPRIEHEAGAYVVDTGASRFRIDRRRLMPFELIGLAGKRVEPVTARVDLRRANGKLSQAIIERSEIEAHGAVRTTILLEGRFPGARGLRFRCRLCFFAGTGLAHVRLTLHNPNRARHRGGLWDLGDPSSILFKDLSLSVKASSAPVRTSFAAEPDHEAGESPAGVEIYQDSSGGENWQSRNHVNREGRVPCRFRGYRVRCGTIETNGERASPIVAVTGREVQVTAAIAEFWQQFPKLLAAEQGELRIGLFPAEWDDLHELQAGEQKTHAVWLHFGQPAADPVEPLAWVHAPAAAMPDPRWTATTQAVTPFLPASDDSEPRWRALLGEAIDCDRGLVRRREVIDEYGWRHYGEIYADHENTYYRDPPPIVSHYNNQYDVVQGTLLQWLRTGDRRWLELADPLARHVIDVDIYHTVRDRAAYSGGLFWHTDHYLDAGISTHRSFSRQNCPSSGAPYGGGPGAEHNYTSGLLLYYYLTGDRQARQSVLELADWVLRMDDGRNNVLGLIDGDSSGVASATDTPTWHGPGRGAANSMNALLDAWLLTHRPHYLGHVEALIRRVVHPDRCIGPEAVLNVEAYWSYTVFLQVLSRYRDVKAEQGHFDATYDYARAVLVAYGKWMAENERPYFDHPEQLEYPTEAWAAQEFKKGNALLLAARYACGADRAAWRARGAALIDRAWTDLDRFDTRGSARSLAIAFVESVRSMQLLADDDELPVPTATASKTGDWPAWNAFVPQKQRVLRQLASARGLLSAARRVFTFEFWRVLLALLARRWQAAPAERTAPTPTPKPGTGRRLKLAVLYASRAAGLFRLARLLTRGKLRILCYHGFALSDETSFRPRLFIEPTTLARRIRYLQRHRVPVVPLSEALDMLDRRDLPPAATVITIDDGFFSTRQVLLSLFASAGMPATVYVTSYYADKQSPVFRLAVQYMFWKTGASRLDLNELTPDLAGALDLDDRAASDRALTAVMDYGEQSLDEPGRTRCLRRLGELLDVDYDELVSSRRLSLMTAEEIRSVAAAGFDIQLHTHRHRFPVDEEIATQEVRDNRRWLEDALGLRADHFCYPSGLWAPEHFSPLASEGVRSAVTCDPGLNDASSHRLALHRFLDGENIAQIEFEAEISGYLEILRKLRARWANGRRR